MAPEDDLLRQLNEEFRKKGSPPDPDEAVREEAEARTRSLQEREVRVLGVYNHPASGPFVVLRDSQSRNLPIWIDEMQAQSIQAGIEGAETARPMTHDLMKLLMERFGGVLEYVLIDDLYNGVYYAKLGLARGDQRSEVDCRPSDALALAVRFKALIYVADAVLEENHLEISEE